MPMKLSFVLHHSIDLHIILSLAVYDRLVDLLPALGLGRKGVRYYAGTVHQIYQNYLTSDVETQGPEGWGIGLQHLTWRLQPSILERETESCRGVRTQIGKLGDPYAPP